MKNNLFNNIVVILFLLLLANVSFAEQPDQADEDFTKENNNKITIELKPDTDENALGAAKAVHDFYFEHLKICMKEVAGLPINIFHPKQDRFSPC